MREIDMMLRAIDRRKHNEYAAQAGLHGIKVPFRYNKEAAIQKDAVTEVSEKDQALMNRMRAEAQQRVRARRRV